MIANTEYLRHYSGMKGDPLTDILTLVRPVRGSGHLGSWTLLDAAIPSAPKDQICRSREGQLLAHRQRRGLPLSRQDRRCVRAVG
jgi:hypothetical protein